MPDHKPSPAMQQYLDVKAQNSGSILLFRMGDFYELFYEDAETASRVLGLTLTSRDKGSANPTPMAGFPYHQLDTYLRRLIQAGFRAAVCEQMEDPAQAKGIVKREVTRIVTPGTITDDALLDPRASNFLACLFPPSGNAAGKVCGLAWLELSTGRFQAFECEPQNLSDEFARLQPSECLVPEGWDRRLLEYIPPQVLFTTRPSWDFSPGPAKSLLEEHFGVHTLAGFGWEGESAAITAAGALLTYVRETQKTALSHIALLEPFRRETSLILDEATRRSLELTRTLRDTKRDGSLLWAIDETVSPMGSRLLADWLSSPLTDLAAINRRLDAVGEFAGAGTLCNDVRELLKPIYDLQRLTARVATGRASPRDLRFLANTLEALPRLKSRLANRQTALLVELEAALDLCADVRDDVNAALLEDPPLAVTEGNLIRAGYNAQLDELRDLARGGKEWIARYQAGEAERLGLPGLKVGFNKVFGYYLEFTTAQLARLTLPPEYVRKQTLKNQERFITPELKQHEDKVLRSEQQSQALEFALFGALRERVAAQGGRLNQTAAVLAQIDVLCGLATLAVRQNYRRPEVVTEPILDIREGRHPVLDKLLARGHFVPNDTLVGGPHGRVQLITGPNMAGKSTYIRQTALITILAQIGSYVPAASAVVGIADRIFARVGASDELGRGQSTFMVEMTETARILNAATERSLVILDEIGRGTSTYDGISLAWSVTEFLHDVVGARTLFATHYHELTDLTQSLSRASNWNVAVREQNDSVVFLHKIIEGSADKSYGIHVARLAGIPLMVVERARVILQTLEAAHVDTEGQVKVPPRSTKRPRYKQLPLFPEMHPVLDEIRDMDLTSLTGEEALARLRKLRENLSQ